MTRASTVSDKGKIEASHINDIIADYLSLTDTDPQSLASYLIPLKVAADPSDALAVAYPGADIYNTTENRRKYSNGTSWVHYPEAGGGGGAPTDAQYLVLSLDATLSQEVVHSTLTGANLHIPKVHSPSHAEGSTDPLKLDDCAVPDDNADLDVSASKHGLVPKAPNDATKYLDGTGAYTIPAAGASGTQKTLPVYVIYKSGATYYAKDDGGTIDYSDTDATQVINDAIQNLSNTVRKEMVSLKGTFNLDEDGSNGYAIYMDSNVILDLRNANLILNNTQNCDMIRIEGSNSNRKGSMVIGGHLDGNKANQTSGNGIVVDMGAQSVLRDITIEDVEDDGVKLTKVDSVQSWGGWHLVDNVRVWFSGRYGFYTNYQSDCDFARCIVQQNDSSGFYIWYPQNFYRCHPTNVGKHGFDLQGGGNVLVNCYANISQRHAFYLASDGNRLVACHGDYASQETDNTYDVVRIDGSKNQIHGGWFNGQGGGSYTDDAKYAINENTGNYNIYLGGRSVAGDTGNVRKTGANSDFDHYITS